MIVQPPPTSPSPLESAGFGVRLHSRPGQGLLARHGATVLFLPDPGDGATPLLRALFDAAPGRELDELAGVIVAHQFEVPAFACVSVRAEITLRAYGDLQLRTDQVSAPLLSAAGSTTWVDHRLHGQPTSVTITTSWDDAVASNGDVGVTDLTEGVAFAGGFCLLAAVQPDRSPAAPPDLAPAAQPNPARPDLAPAAPPDLAPAAQPNPAQTDLPPDPATAPPPALPPQPMTSIADVVLETFPDSTDTIDTLPPPLLTNESGSERQPPPASPAILDLEGREISIGPGERLVFGRNPATSDQQDRIHRLSGDRISRTHLIVHHRPGGLEVEDAGSRNGSVVLPHATRTPIELVAGTPHPIGVGDTVYLGSSQFTVRHHSEVPQ